MQRLLNPYRQMAGYNCFGCSPDNENGLRMEFYDDGEYIVCRWDPRDCFQGFLNMLHGGIQSTLLDEIASWVVMTKLKTSGVTSRLNVRYLKPVKTDEGTLTIKGHVKEVRHRIAVIRTEIFNAKDELVTSGEATYFLFSEEDAGTKLNYPGKDSFYRQ